MFSRYTNTRHLSFLLACVVLVLPTLHVHRHLFWPLDEPAFEPLDVRRAIAFNATQKIKRTRAPAPPLDTVLSPVNITAAPLRRTRLLLGLFHRSQEPVSQELIRRRTIEKTWTTYKDVLDPSDNPIICTLPQLKKDTSRDRCLITYVYVLGDEKAEREDNGVYFPGHSHASDILVKKWFQLAGNLEEELQVDYVGFLDTRTLLFPERLIRNRLHDLPAYPYNRGVIEKPWLLGSVPGEDGKAVRLSIISPEYARQGLVVDKNTNKTYSNPRILYGRTMVDKNLMEMRWLKQQTVFDTSVLTATNLDWGKRPKPNRSDNHPRIFIGFTSPAAFSFKEATWRQVIRHILREDGIVMDDSRVCRIRQFNESCRVVYAFVTGGKDQGFFKRWSKGMATYWKPTGEFPFVNEIAIDTISLHASEQSVTDIGIAWWHYVSTFHAGEFDYVGFVGPDSILFPSEFLEHNPQWNVYPNRNFAVGSAPYACGENMECDDGNPSYRGMIMLSHDLVKAMVDQGYPRHLEKLKTDEYSGGINMVKVQVLIDEAVKGQQLSVKRLDRLHHRRVRDALSRTERWTLEWEKYYENWIERTGVNAGEPDDDKVTKDLILSSIGNSTSRTPRMLIGILSMDSKTETDRRNLIRSTWTSFFSKYHGRLRYIELNRSNRTICKLDEVVKNKELLHHRDHCQIVYTFVLGGRGQHQNITERVSYSDQDPMEVRPPRSTSANGSFEQSLGDETSVSLRNEHQTEGDMVFLNIAENMNDGKSQTWFYFASSYMLERHGIYFDYIAKTDTDTLIFPGTFKKVELDSLPGYPKNQRIYGGGHEFKPFDDGPKLGPTYMKGQLYFMSNDLARYITSKRCDRSYLSVGVEDKDHGAFVNSHPLPIVRHELRKRGVFRHPVKDLKNYQQIWDRYASEASNAFHRNS